MADRLCLSSGQLDMQFLDHVQHFLAVDLNESDPRLVCSANCAVHARFLSDSFPGHHLARVESLESQGHRVRLLPASRQQRDRQLEAIPVVFPMPEAA